MAVSHGAERFNTAAQRMVTQFNAYEPLPGLHINGKASLGENIADYGGLLLGLLLAVVARACARVGGRRRAALINRRLRDSVTRVAEERIVEPVREVLRRHAATRENLDRARA